MAKSNAPAKAADKTKLPDPAVNPQSSTPDTSGVNLDDGVKNLGTISNGVTSESISTETLNRENNSMLSKHEPKSGESVYVEVDETYTGSMRPGTKYLVSKETADDLVSKGGVTIVE